MIAKKHSKTTPMESTYAIQAPHQVLLPQNPSVLQRNEVPYDADHVLKLDLEQDKLMQVLSRCGELVVIWSDEFFQKPPPQFSAEKVDHGPLKLFQNEPGPIGEILGLRDKMFEAQKSRYKKVKYSFGSTPHSGCQDYPPGLLLVFCRESL